MICSQLCRVLLANPILFKVKKARCLTAISLTDLRQDEFFHSRIHKKSGLQAKPANFIPDIWEPADEFGMNQFTKYSGYHQPAMPGSLTSAFFVNEQHIGFELAGERDGGSFSGIQRERQLRYAHSL